MITEAYSARLFWGTVPTGACFFGWVIYFLDGLLSVLSGCFYTLGWIEIGLDFSVD